MLYCIFFVSYVPNDAKSRVKFRYFQRFLSGLQNKWIFVATRCFRHLEFSILYRVVVKRKKKKNSIAIRFDNEILLSYKFEFSSGIFNFILPPNFSHSGIQYFFRFIIFFNHFFASLCLLWFVVLPLQQQQQWQQKRCKEPLTRFLILELSVIFFGTFTIPGYVRI